MITHTHTPLVAGNLVVKILVARQLPTNIIISYYSPVETSLFLLDDLLTVLHRNVLDLRLKVSVRYQRLERSKVKGPSSEPRELLAKEGRIRPKAIGHRTSREEKELLILTDTADVNR